MQIISARDNENSNERETQKKKKQRQKRTRRRKVIVKGWELNDFAVCLKVKINYMMNHI